MLSDKWTVTCITPTHRPRARFIPRLLKVYDSQLWKHKEMIFVANPDETVDLPAEYKGRKDIRVIQGGPGIGPKFNAALEVAAGRYCAKFDDDDWYGPRRLFRQMEPIALGRAQVTAFPDSWAFDMKSGEWWRSRNNNRYWFHDASLVFDRQALQPGVDFGRRYAGEGLYFMHRALKSGMELAVVENQGDFVYMRHGNNTWRFNLVHLYKKARKPWFFPAELEAAYRI